MLNGKIPCNHDVHLRLGSSEQNNLFNTEGQQSFLGDQNSRKITSNRSFSIPSCYRKSRVCPRWLWLKPPLANSSQSALWPVFTSNTLQVWRFDMWLFVLVEDKGILVTGFPVHSWPTAFMSRMHGGYWLLLWATLWRSRTRKDRWGWQIHRKETTLQHWSCILCPPAWHCTAHGFISKTPAGLLRLPCILTWERTLTIFHTWTRGGADHLATLHWQTNRDIWQISSSHLPE